MNYTRALTRRPDGRLVDGLALADLGRVDIKRALAQHAAYTAALRACGLTVVELPPDPAHPDACFVEDTAIVTARGALLTRPGHPSRQGEVASVATALAAEFGQIGGFGRITAPGTLDGGDVCQLDGHFLIGLSSRTNEQGAQQLLDWLEARGYTANIVNLRGLPALLHLKTGLSWLGERRVAVVAEFADHPALARYVKLVVSPEEAYAASCLRFGPNVLVVAGNLRFEAALRGLGLKPMPLEMTEFRKVDGGLSCLSLRY
jgi:dimethylargininase